MNPISCEQARTWISDLLAGEIEEQELAALEAHQESCAACRSEIDRLFVQDRALGELAGASLTEDLKARVHEGLVKTSRRRRRIWGLSSAAAAILIGTVLYATGVLTTSGETAVIATLERVRGEVFVITKDAEEKAEVGATLSSGQGVRSRGPASHALLRYPDGTELQLGGETTLERLENGDRGQQLFLARGTLRGSIAKQPVGRPMVFSSPHARATVLGTRLRLVVEPKAKGASRLEVEEGSVRLTNTRDGAVLDVPAGSFAVAAPDVKLVAQPLRTTGKAIQIKAGETLTLTEDLVLSGDDTLDIQGSADKRCTLAGNHHRIRSSGAWSGRLKISHCDLRDVGDRVIFGADGRLASQAHAVDLSASKSAEVTIDHSTFVASSTVRLHLDGQSSARFADNLCPEDAVVWVDKAVERTVPFFEATGGSPSPKFFQGNRIYRSGVQITGKNWTIGGESDAESNLIIGLRAGLFAYGEGVVVRGNYLHVLMPRTAEYPYWSQVATFTSAKGALAENNVIRDGEWIVQFVEGEFRRNLICDINDHNLLRNASTGRIHHNIFVAGKPEHPPGQMGGCIFIVYPPRQVETGAEIFNNTFDAGGTMNVPGIEVNSGGLVKSLRNNVFFNFAHQEKFVSSAQAMVRPAWAEPLSDPPPLRLGYADYNLFFSPLAKTKKNYALAVAGKTERKDAGFGLNDVPRGGAPNEQADPKFKGPVPPVFAFSDDDIKSGKATVSKILAFYRDAYTPAPGSPLIDAGDPADGQGTDIGAVEAGK